jgi:flavorubredoxin
MTDYNEPIEIAPDTYWVGRRTELNLEMNVYLRIFKGNGQKINMLIDPGPSPDFEVISTKIEKVLGPDEPIHLAYINHQDPDVCINTIFFQRHHPGLQVITSEDTWRLIRFYGLKTDRFIPIEKFKSGRIKLPTGHKLRFIPTPYAHFRGACALYDDEHAILYSGDLFGGLSETPGLYADEEYWEGVKTFHQIYMPANLALKKAVYNFRTLAPNMKILAPQHGKIIKGELVDDFMARMEALPVGLDLETSTLALQNFISAFNDILNAAAEKISPEVKKQALEAFLPDGSFPGIITVKKDTIIGLKGETQDALKTFARQLCSTLDNEQKAKMRPIFVQALAQWHITGDNLCPDNSQEAASEKDEIDKLLDELLDI